MTKKPERFTDYLKTLAILKVIKSDPTEDDFKQAFKFYWENKRFFSKTYEEFIHTNTEWEQKLLPMISDVTQEEADKMKTALSDSYHSISKSAELVNLDKAMIKRLVEHRTLRVIQVKNPYYKTSPPMHLIRMSELQKWMQENPSAVAASRKTLEIAEKAKKTRETNKNKKFLVYKNLIEPVLNEFEQLSDSEPVPLLFLLLKFLQLSLPNSGELKQLFKDKMINIVKIADPTHIKITKVIEIEEIEDILLCDRCRNSAASLHILISVYLEKFGKCSNCISQINISEIGRHHELTFSRGDVNLIFLVGGSLLSDLRKILPESINMAEEQMKQTRGNIWDNIPKSEIPFEIYEILLKMSNILTKLNDDTIPPQKKTDNVN
ncbi:MAG: hypothetical protein ACYDAO_00255 [Thermoplasmataceae archaeon]